MSVLYYFFYCLGCNGRICVNWIIGYHQNFEVESGLRKLKTYKIVWANIVQLFDIFFNYVQV